MIRTSLFSSVAGVIGVAAAACRVVNEISGVVLTNYLIALNQP